MIPGVVRHAGFRQTAARRDKTVDAPPRAFMPLDVERAQLRKELQIRIRQVVVNPPGKRAPVGTAGISVGEPRDDDTGGRPDASVRVAPILDMSGVVLFVRCAVQPVAVAEIVQRGGAKPAADIDAAKGGVQRLQKFRTQFAPGGDGDVGVVRYVRDPVDCGNFAEQKITQEK